MFVVITIQSFFFIHECIICSNSNTTGITYGAETAYHCGSPEFNTGVMQGPCCLLFRLLCNVIVCSCSFDHCIVLPSSSYCFWIPLCYIQSFPTFIVLLVIDVKNVLNYPPFLMHFSDLILLFRQLIILLFLATVIVLLIYIINAYMTIDNACSELTST